MFRLFTVAYFFLGALAQTPPNLWPSTQQNFSVEYSNKSFTAGQLLKTSGMAPTFLITTAQTVQY